MTTRIGLLIFDEVEELDFVGPWEVFTSAAQVREGISQPSFLQCQQLAARRQLLALRFVEPEVTVEGFDHFAHARVHGVFAEPLQVIRNLAQVLLDPGPQGVQALAVRHRLVQPGPGFWAKVCSRRQ